MDCKLKCALVGIGSAIVGGGVVGTALYYTKIKPDTKKYEKFEERTTFLRTITVEKCASILYELYNKLVKEDKYTENKNFKTEVTSLLKIKKSKNEYDYEYVIESLKDIYLLTYADVDNDSIISKDEFVNFHMTVFLFQCVNQMKLNINIITIDGTGG